jgi:uncharacterized protein
MLWRVANSNLCLLGSIHLSNEPVQLSETSRRLVDECHTLAFEANMAGLPPGLGDYKNDRELRAVVSDDLWNATRDRWLALGQDELKLNRHEPWWAGIRVGALIFESRGLCHKFGVEAVLSARAKELNKPTFYLEQQAAGFKGLSAVPLEEQVRFLSRAVYDAEEGYADVVRLHDAWIANRPTDMEFMYEKGMRLTPGVFTAMIPARNKAWLSHLLRFARGGRKVVAVVGALHMLGPEGLPLLLEQKGFPCEHVAHP